MKVHLALNVCFMDLPFIGKRFSDSDFGFSGVIDDLWSDLVIHTLGHSDI
jgi:hypothetical protein